MSTFRGARILAASRTETACKAQSAIAFSILQIAMTSPMLTLRPPIQRSSGLQRIARALVLCLQCKVWQAVAQKASWRWLRCSATWVCFSPA